MGKVKKTQPKKSAELPETGKVALVTGGGVRLGRAIALTLARRGCDVIVHYRSSRTQAQNVAREIRAQGRRAEVLRADLAKDKSVLALAKAAENVFGRIDILVNNAAVFWPTPLAGLTARELDAFLSVNLKAPFILCSEIGRRMKERGSGVIVNLACVSAFRPWKTHVPYSISKAGVVALTTGMAKLLGPQVRVNAIAPGTVLPPEKMSREQVKRLAQRVPLKKNGTPEDIAAAVVYLVEASFVTGQVLCVDGGRSIV